MRRYIDFQNENWYDRTDGRMQEARWEACLCGAPPEPPCAGVIDTLPIDFLEGLIEYGWVRVPNATSEPSLRKQARLTVYRTLMDDADCLSPEEHALVERMLLGGGIAEIETVAAFEAAYTLQMRLWCDLGVHDHIPCARLDAGILARLPGMLMRKEHRERRARIFIYNGMLHGLIYLTGYIDERIPIRRFIEEVLQANKTEHTIRLAKNYVEASFDCETIGGCDLLIHSSLAAPGTLMQTWAMHDGHDVQLTPSQLIGSMSGLLPGEVLLDKKMRLALSGALRPEIDEEKAAQDLRMLIKQGAPIQALRDIMAGMLCVLPTEHMENTLLEMNYLTPRWIAPPPTMAEARTMGGNTVGYMH